MTDLFDLNVSGDTDISHNTDVEKKSNEISNITSHNCDDNLDIKIAQADTYKMDTNYPKNTSPEEKLNNFSEGVGRPSGSTSNPTNAITTVNKHNNIIDLYNRLSFKYGSCKIFWNKNKKGE